MVGLKRGGIGGFGIVLSSVAALFKGGILVGWARKCMLVCMYVYVDSKGDLGHLLGSHKKHPYFSHRATMDVLLPTTSKPKIHTTQRIHIAIQKIVKKKIRISLHTHNAKRLAR